VSNRTAFATKSLFVGFSLLASLFSLLAYIPFTAQQFVKSEVFPILNDTARLQPYLYWFLLLLAAPAIGLKRSFASVGFWVLHIAAGVFFLVHPVLAHVETTEYGFRWALAFMIPVLWVAALDWIDALPRIRWAPTLADQDRAIFQAAWRAALFAAAIWGGIAVVEHQPIEWKASAGWLGFGASLLTHQLVFLLFFVLLNWLGVVANWFPLPPRAQFLLCHLLGGTLLYLVFESLVFRSLTFAGAEGIAYAAAFSFVVTLFVAGSSLQRAKDRTEEAASGLSIALGVWVDSPRSRGGLFATAVALVALAAGASLTLSRNDWNFLLQKTLVLAIWILAFRMFFSNASRGTFRPSATGRLLTCALLILPTYRSWEAAKMAAWDATGEKQTLQHFLDQWSGYDVSFKLIRDVMYRDSEDQGFYRFLAENTNISRSVHVAPVPVNLVDQLEYSEGSKPNIFMIVVDSLRRDYLSPYNSQVDFTPRIGEFAKEGVVMENAFTHYGATGLSEPSIWVGGMTLHKQYVTPFAPMNSLQKLLEREKYKALISRDTILRVVAPDWPGMEELDKGRDEMNYDLCRSLQELDGRISNQPKGARLFAYTQPQNIHISVINRAGAKPISNENYGSFYAPYASRLNRMDGCFGAFIDHLKEEGLYNSSIVILTSDHGDSLGEQGRWGHAYSIYPEIVRIPMIIHVPPKIRQSLHVDPKATVFSTDLTPTLYYLTGHKPANRGEIFGRPLFVETPEELAAYRRSSYLIASSYGAVYGILSGDGTELDVFDAVNYKNYSFDLRGLFGGQSGLSSSRRASDAMKIREKVLNLDQYYQFTPTRHR